MDLTGYVTEIPTTSLSAATLGVTCSLWRPNDFGTYLRDLPSLDSLALLTLHGRSALYFRYFTIAKPSIKLIRMRYLSHRALLKYDRCSFTLDRNPRRSLPFGAGFIILGMGYLSRSLDPVFSKIYGEQDTLDLIRYGKRFPTPSD